MSLSGSGTSTPRGAITPPPNTTAPATGTTTAAATSSDGPSPLTVGTRFVKQYYKVLSTTPDQIDRFYQPSLSLLSDGVGSQPTQPKVFSESKGDDAVDKTTKEDLKDRFTMEGYEPCPIRFELEHGAIDAQMSMNGGVLLVVTGHIVYLDHTDDSHQQSHQQPRRKGFVHTFFLGSTLSSSGKRSYYVHNDILRFLVDPPAPAPISLVVDEEKTVVASNISSDTAIEITPTAVEVEEPKPETVQVVSTADHSAPADEDEPLQEEAPPADVVEEEAVTQSSEVLAVSKDTTDHVMEAPGGGVEETKEVAAEEEEAELPAAVDSAAIVADSSIDAKKVDTTSKVLAVSEEVEKKVSENGGLEASTLSAPLSHSKSPALVPLTRGGAASAAPSITTSTAAKKPTNAKPNSWASLVAGGATTTSTPATTNNISAPPTPTAVMSIAKPTMSSATAQPVASKPVVVTPEASAVESSSSTSGAAAATTTTPSTSTPSTANNTTSKAGPVPSATTTTAQAGAGGNGKPRAFEGTSSSRPGSGGPAASKFPNKRDPDCTLVIKNIDMSTTQTDILGMFESFATATETKVVGCTVSANRGIAFVDYDSPAPVVMAVDQHTNKDAFQLHGRTLDVYQKTLEQRGRGGGGRGGGPPGAGGGGGKGYYRGGGGGGSQQPGNNGAFRPGRDGSGGGGGGGGRQQQSRRHPTGRGGDRGGGGGDRGGGMGGGAGRSGAGRGGPGR